MERIYSLEHNTWNKIVTEVSWDTNLFHFAPNYKAQFIEERVLFHFHLLIQFMEKNYTIVLFVSWIYKNG